VLAKMGRPGLVNLGRLYLAKLFRRQQRLKDLVEENSKTAKRRELMMPLLMVLNG